MYTHIILRMEKIVNDSSANCGGTNILDLITANSEWNYIDNLPEADENYYTHEQLAKIRQEGEDITTTIHNILEVRNKLKQKDRLSIPYIN